MAKYIKEIIKISGMTCNSCENIISERLKKTEGINKVKVSLKSSDVQITYNSEITDKKTIIKIINDLGYSVYNKDDNYLFGIIVLVGIILYIIFKDSNIFSNIPKIDTDMSYGILFIIGLLTSVHCIFMCGGINIALVANYNADKKVKKIVKPGLMYNLGRITSYTILGGIVGLIGSVFEISQIFKDSINVIVGSIMIFLALKMSGIIRLPKRNIKMPLFIVKTFRFLRSKVKSPYLIGIINGFMPCGPLQSMQLYALSTMSFINGAFSMFIFSLGTVPLMMGLSIGSSFLSGRKSVVLKRLSAAFILLLGIIMIGRSVDFKTILQSNYIDKTAIKAEIKEEYQEVTTRFERGRYKPIVVQKGILVKWYIIIEKGDLNGCNNEIFIPEYNIKEKLEYGINVIEFIPEKIGPTKYTCWMNMLRSNIYVVDNIEKLS